MVDFNKKVVDSFPERLKTAIGTTSVASFAKKVNIADSMLRKYLSGESLPGMEKLFELAAGSNVRPEWLLTGEEPMRPVGMEAGLSAAERVTAVSRASQRLAAVSEPGRVLTELRHRTDQWSAEVESRISDFAEYMGVEPEALTDAVLLAGDYTLIPRRDVKAAAGNAVILPAEEIVDFIVFRTDFIRYELGLDPKNLVVIQAKGDSMIPTIRDGDLLLVDLSQAHDADNAIYVLNVDGRVMVKRLQFLLGGVIEVQSDNPKYKPETVRPEDRDLFRLVGRVVWAGSRL